MLLILQKFVTCEGRFGTMYVYHIRLLMNFLDDGEINLPFFLLNSLKRMASNVQKRVQFLETTLHHHGLVKMLIEFHLKKIGDNWEEFFLGNHFQDREETSSKEENFRRSRRRKNDKAVENKHDTSSQEESEELISEKLTKIRKQIRVKRKEKITSKYTDEENENPPKLRRSSRLKGIMKKTLVKNTWIINVEDEETPVQTPVDRSPLHQFEEDPNKGTPDIDPAQQQIYDYVESLERKASKNQERSLSPQEPPIETLRKDNCELEILNKHIKNENEILREQVKLKNAMNDTLTLQLGTLHKENRKLKKRNKKLNRALINLRFKLFMRKPRMTLTTKRGRKIRMDVLADVLEHME